MSEVLENVDPDDSDSIDADKTTYNKEAVLKVRSEAVKIAKTMYRLELSPDEAKIALGLFPKVWSAVCSNNKVTDI